VRVELQHDSVMRWMAFVTQVGRPRCPEAATDPGGRRLLRKTPCIGAEARVVSCVGSLCVGCATPALSGLLGVTFAGFFDQCKANHDVVYC
jgi:hypothetical protein